MQETQKQETTMASHAPALMKRDQTSADYYKRLHVCFFACPVCGKRKKQYLNVLGNQNRLVCSGNAIKKINWTDITGELE